MNYDASGNMTRQRDNSKDLTKQITIDSENRIFQVQDALGATVGRYWYDEGGFRVRKLAVVPSGAGSRNQEVLYPSKFYGLEYLEEENVLRSINNIYLNGVRIAALNEEGTTAYFLTDQVDSVAHVLDEEAHTLSRTQYEPYGETLVQRGNQDLVPKYNSQELDRETNFYFYNARYYDPQIARFTSADTVIDGARSTQGWNRFSYVAGNPIRYKDPTGHDSVEPYLSPEQKQSASSLNNSLSYVRGFTIGLASRSMAALKDKASDIGYIFGVTDRLESYDLQGRSYVAPSTEHVKRFDEGLFSKSLPEGTDLEKFVKGLNHGTGLGLAGTEFTLSYLSLGRSKYSGVTTQSSRSLLASDKQLAR
ncbi:RHS repeat-associated core domain protein [Leptospira wolffii serovar Khorat str. Khorat-H2]|nr:RHS repeat-associated core domain protein [Leptospira wolffii serovar Khorat str. Khorat-H2]